MVQIYKECHLFVHAIAVILNRRKHIGLYIRSPNMHVKGAQPTWLLPTIVFIIHCGRGTYNNE